VKTRGQSLDFYITEEEIMKISVCCAFTIVLFSMNVFSDSLCPPVSDSSWARPRNAVTAGNAVELPANTEKYTATSVLLNAKPKTIYEVRFQVLVKGEAKPESRIAVNTTMPLAYEERFLSPNAEVFRTFLFNDTTGKKWINFLYRSGNKNGVMRISDVTIREFDPGKEKKIILNEPLAWRKANWSSPGTVFTTEPVSDHIDTGDALCLSLPQTVQNAKSTIALRSCPIPFNPDSEYRISAWLKGNAPGTAGLGIDCWFGKQYKHYYKGEKFSIGTEWKKYSFLFRSPSAAEFPVLELGRTRGCVTLGSGTNLKKLYLKNWTIEKTR
jgi:carbohydrate binding domain